MFLRYAYGYVGKYFSKKKKFKFFFSLNLRMKLNYLTIKAMGFLTF